MPSELHLTTRKTVSISYLVQAVGARCDRLLPQPQKTLTAFPSGHRCLRHPKVKVFALKGSPNVPHVANIAQSTQIPAEYLCDALIVVYNTCQRR
jgi:hypothetical protein